jgi:hypothetical protein
MPGYVVFVRFFLGYTESFPFDCFVHLKDDAIAGAVEALRKDWWSKPANRKRVQASRRELASRRKDWAQGILARPGRNLCLPGATVSNADGQQAEETGPASFEEIVAAAGWRCSAPDGLAHGITPRYPVAQFDTKELADDAAAAVRERVKELAEAAYAKTPWSEEDELFGTANPHFVVVGETELSRPELAHARERISRIRGPVAGPVSLQEGLLRFYWPKIQETLAQLQADQQQEPLPADGPLDNDRFGWEGVAYSIPHFQWLLLKALWKKPKGVSTNKVLKVVYGEDEGERRLKSLANDLKTTLLKYRIPYAPSSRSEKWRLVHN